jgi:hypothetical protein
MKIWLKWRGGEEDGVSNEHIDSEKLLHFARTYQVYEALPRLGTCSRLPPPCNVHGVYKPGNVKLSPEKSNHQDYAKKMSTVSSQAHLWSTEAQVPTMRSRLPSRTELNGETLIPIPNGRTGKASAP